MIIYHNGHFIEDQTIFEFQDRLRLGDGIFDTMLIADGKPQHIDEHISRLTSNAKTLKINITPNAQKIKNAALKLIKSNKVLEGRFALNTLISRGIAARGLMPNETAKPSIAMRIAPAPSEFPAIHAIISNTIRRNEGSPLSQIKSCNYGDNILALIEAKEQGANEAILLNNAGNITCSSAGNIFCCINDKLVTPPLSDGVMNGITRSILIQKYNATERSITENELEKSHGIYITNSIRGASALQSLNGKPLPAPSVKIDKDFHLE